MKLYFKIGIVLVLALLAWLLLQEKAETISRINTVSLQTNSVVTPEKPIKNNAAQKPQAITKSEISEEEKAHLAKELKKLSYIQLYDMSEDLYECIGYLVQLDSKNNGLKEYGEENNSLDFIQEYSQKIPQLSHSRQQQATDKQLNYYREHIENCQSMVAKVKSLYNEEESKLDNFYIQTKLRALMKETQVKSDEEKTLKSVLDNKVSLRKALEDLVILKKGKPTVTEEKIRDLTQEIDELKWEIYRVKQAPKEIREENLVEMEASIMQKREYLTSLFEFDKSAYEKKSGEFYWLIDRIKSQIHSKYPRVFKEVFEGLNFKESLVNSLPSHYILRQRKQSGIQIPIVSEQIFESILIQNKIYFNKLLQPALDLYLCYLGDDCRLPNNPRLAKFCFMPSSYFASDEGVYFESCDMDLETFYFEHYLTENQVEDLSLIFDYMVGNYAQ
jgi:hypothetical protein